MASWDLQSADVYGAVVAINFADRTLHAAATSDFVEVHPVASLDQLVE
jgi:hypothetical protein